MSHVNQGIPHPSAPRFDRPSYLEKDRHDRSNTVFLILTVVRASLFTMATETLTAPARVAQSKRRYSAETSYSHFDANKKRTNSVNIASVHRQNQRNTLAPVPEDEQLKAVASKRTSRRQSRMSKAFSWSTNWNFAGESTRSTQFTGDETSSNDDKRLSKIGRRLSSISSYASTVADFIATEPSHETNFPKGLEFPKEGGFKLCVSIYGTVDALQATTMRLLMPRGSKYADFTGAKDYISALEHICKLKNGDMLCRPTKDIEKSNPGAAVILRGTVQDFVYKCFVVGTFPMALLFDDALPGTYEMDVTIF